MRFVEKCAEKHYGQEYVKNAVLFRTIAPQVDNNPDEIFKYINEKPVKELYTLRTLDAERFFRLYEASTYGDIGALFASPRTCLSGILLQFIGTEEQQNYYFDHMEYYKVRSFFATTELNIGSDASQLETSIKKCEDSLSVSGDKVLVGNLGLANIGVIIGRVNSGPLGLSAILVKPTDFESNPNNVQRQTLPMFGIRAALLGQASFRNFLLPKTQLLGQDLRAAERGLQAVIKTFNVMRLGITGLALGHSQAILDYVESTRRILKTHEKHKIDLWQNKLSTIRKLAISAAQNNKQNRLNTAEISLVKVQASQLAESVNIGVTDFYGSEFLYEHPYLVKSLRDCFGYEYMDGTTNIQRKNIYQGFSHVVF